MEIAIMGIHVKEHVLSVFCHQIAEEEALMAVALFPMLHELDIHSNPLTTERSGNLVL